MKSFNQKLADAKMWADQLGHARIGPRNKYGFDNVHKVYFENPRSDAIVHVELSIKCRAVFHVWRWPRGFVCPACHSKKYSIVGKRNLYECRACKRQTSVFAGTIFAHSRIPPTKWVYAMTLLEEYSGISTYELARKLGLQWDTTKRMRRTLLELIAERKT
jgi:transposase-like protein